jgi:hypothetical protein
LEALEIFALAAADITRFFTRVRSRLADLPRAFAADCKPIKSFCNLPNCFLTFFSSRLMAASMLMDPPQLIYLRDRLTPIPFLLDVVFNLLALGMFRQFKTICLTKCFEESVTGTPRPLSGPALVASSLCLGRRSTRCTRQGSLRMAAIHSICSDPFERAIRQTRDSRVDRGEAIHAEVGKHEVADASR